MAKLYFDRSEIARNKVLDEELRNLIEQGIARHEQQGTFRELYDLDIMGIAVYYKKNWSYEGLSRRGNRKELQTVGAE